jgi:glycopeptide antibiotics resistance protein
MSGLIVWIPFSFYMATTYPERISVPVIVFGGIVFCLVIEHLFGRRGD